MRGVSLGSNPARFDRAKLWDTLRPHSLAHPPHPFGTCARRRGAAGRHRTRSFSVSSQREEAGAANPSLRLDPPHSPSEPPSGVHDGALALAPAAAQAIDLLQSQRTQHQPPRVRGWPEGSRAAVSPVGRARRRTRKPGRSVARVPLSQSFSPEPQCCRNAQEYTRTLALSQRADEQRVQGIGGRIGREGRGSPPASVSRVRTAVHKPGLSLNASPRDRRHHSLQKSLWLMRCSAFAHLDEREVLLLASVRPVQAIQAYGSSEPFHAAQCRPSATHAGPVPAQCHPSAGPVPPMPAQCH